LAEKRESTKKSPYHLLRIRDEESGISIPIVIFTEPPLIGCRIQIRGRVGVRHGFVMLIPEEINSLGDKYTWPPVDDDELPFD